MAASDETLSRAKCEQLQTEVDTAEREHWLKADGRQKRGVTWSAGAEGQPLHPPGCTWHTTGMIGGGDT